MVTGTTLEIPNLLHDSIHVVIDGSTHGTQITFTDLDASIHADVRSTELHAAHQELLNVRQRGITTQLVGKRPDIVALRAFRLPGDVILQSPALGINLLDAGVTENKPRLPENPLMRRNPARVIPGVGGYLEQQMEPSFLRRSDVSLKPLGVSLDGFAVRGYGDRPETTPILTEIDNLLHATVELCVFGGFAAGDNQVELAQIMLIQKIQAIPQDFDAHILTIGLRIIHTVRTTHRTPLSNLHHHNLVFLLF